jgi:hypothetical protein
MEFSFRKIPSDTWSAPTATPPGHEMSDVTGKLATGVRGTTKKSKKSRFLKLTKVYFMAKVNTHF